MSVTPRGGTLTILDPRAHAKKNNWAAVGVDLPVAMLRTSIKHSILLNVLGEELQSRESGYEPMASRACWLLATFFAWIFIRGLLFCCVRVLNDFRGYCRALIADFRDCLLTLDADSSCARNKTTLDNPLHLDFTNLHPHASQAALHH